MTKREYRAARRLYRDNGCSALNWLPHDQAMTMDMLLDRLHETDPLAERASIIAYCKRAGVECNVRHTQVRKH